MVVLSQHFTRWHDKLAKARVNVWSAEECRSRIPLLQGADIRSITAVGPPADFVAGRLAAGRAETLHIRHRLLQHLRSLVCWILLLKTVYNV